ncbi:restriction endonuclease subunit S, partial [Patescibacteria group bacterium]|nr:restriction endonuclease subunit S [Patescibacteria group bacterium]
MADETSTIPKGWKMTTLGEVAEISKLQWKPCDKEQKYIGLEHIDQGELTINGFGYSSKLKSNKFYFKTGDVLFGKLRPYFRKVWKAKFDGVCSTDIWVLKAKENNDQNFLFYLVANPIFVSKSMGANTGTHMPRADWDFLKNTEWNIPSLPEQRAIAAVLSSLDDKIELLREQNKTLEATAQAIFKEWFVNFNFPGVGKMIDSEIGKIPEGWRVKKITNVFDFIKGSEPGTANYSTEKLTDDHVPFYRVQDIAKYGDVPNIYIEKKLLRGKIFGADDILISLDGTIGRVFIGGNGGHSGGIRRVVGKEDYIKKSLIFCFLKSSKFQNDLKSFSGAETTIKHAGGAIEHMEFTLNEKVCERFGETSDPLFQKMIFNISQIQILSTLRDALIPKL